MAITKGKYDMSIITGGSAAAGYASPKVSVVLPEPPVELPGGATNILDNSRLIGLDTSSATGWEQRWPGEGTMVFAASAFGDEHRSVRLAGTGALRSAVQQPLPVVAGQRYFVQAVVVAVDDATDADSVILNIAPFSSMTLVGGSGTGDDVRPRLGEVVATDLVWFAFDALVTGNLSLHFGKTGAASGDITFDRLQVDQAAELRAYTPTGVATPPVEGDLNWDTVDYQGYYEGNIMSLGTQQTSNRVVDGDARGWRYQATRTGTIAKMQHQLASNGGDELSKSTYLGLGSPATGIKHEYPAHFPMALDVFKANSSWQRDGAAIFSTTWIYTNDNAGAGSSGDSRVIFEHSPKIAAVQGDRFLFLVRNNGANASARNDNCCSTNMPANMRPDRSSGRPATGLSPPRAVTLYLGDTPLYTNGSIGGSLGEDTSNGRLYNFALRWADGYEEGTVRNDCNSNFTRSIGGSNRVRQAWSKATYYRRATKISLAVLRMVASPAAGITVQISGGAVDQTFTIPASFFPRQGTDPHEFKEYDLPSPVIFAPGVTYTVELRSPSSGATNYEINGIRQAGFNKNADASVGTGAFVSAGHIDANKWSAQAEFSTNGGGSWGFLGYSTSLADSDWPIAFYLGRQMATTLEGLP